jgi:PDZ domain-containing protein
MVLKRALALCATFSLGLTATARAQEPSCAGPGAAFGITSYECEKCGVSWKDGRVQYIFHVEPRVLSVAPGSAFEVGDVVIGFAKKPITTPEGAESFTYPRRAVYFVELRRGGKPTILTARTTIDCSVGPSAGVAAHEPPPPPPPAKDAASADTGRLGFALACRPSCTQMRAANGAVYWNFDGEPPVVAVRPNTPAAAAGLQVGDTVVEIDGKSIIGAEGYFRLFAAQSNPPSTITFTILRDGQRRTITIVPERR